MSVTAAASRGGSGSATFVGQRGNELEYGVQQAPPQNILNLQRRVAGVLPVRVDVPRAGNLYQFYRPLVLDELTQVSFRYKTR